MPQLKFLKSFFQCWGPLLLSDLIIVIILPERSLKIAYFDDIGLRDQNIGWFQIAMNQPHAM